MIIDFYCKYCNVNFLKFDLLERHLNYSHKEISLAEKDSFIQLEREKSLIPQRIRERKVEFKQKIKKRIENKKWSKIVNEIALLIRLNEKWEMGFEDELEEALISIDKIDLITLGKKIKQKASFLKFKDKCLKAFDKKDNIRQFLPRIIECQSKKEIGKIFEEIPPILLVKLGLKHISANRSIGTKNSVRTILTNMRD